MERHYYNTQSRQRSVFGPVLFAIVCGMIACGLIARHFVLREFNGGVAQAVRERSVAMQLSSQVKDRFGADLGVFSDETRFVARLDEIPPRVRQAFLAAEDSGFYKHFGISPTGLTRAIIANIRRDRFAQGGSTITQQLVRQLLLGREKTIWRKVREIVLALELERSMSKSEILELWLNSVYLGNNAWGVETASRHYFGKHVSEISIAEAALLAGLPQAPSRYAPHLRPKLARLRQLYVLQRMKDLRWITPATWQAARREMPRVDAAKITVADQTPWVTEPVRLELWRRLEQRDIPKSGLSVATTIDRSWQWSLQALVANHFKQIRNYGLEAAVAVIDARTGEIRAMTGGTDFNRSQFNRALDLYRPVGAAIYPLIFKWSMEHGLMRVDGYSSIGEAAVKSRFAEAEQLAPEMGYGLVREKLMGLGFIVKDAMAIDEMHGSPVSLARAYLALTNTRIDAKGLIDTVSSGGQVLYRAGEPRKPDNAERQSAQSWVIRQWMALGSDRDSKALAGEPLLKAIKGWNAWWIIARSDVVIAAWVGADQREPRSPQDLRNADQLMDNVLASWIQKNLPAKAGFGAAPDGISYQISPSALTKPAVRIPFLANGQGVF
jgi:membrane carboxypeptidase/penicillin-binding protein